MRYILNEAQTKKALKAMQSMAFKAALVIRLSLKTCKPAQSALLKKERLDQAFLFLWLFKKH